MSDFRHERRSIEHDAPQHWVGWDRIGELYKNACQKDQDNPMRNEDGLFRKGHSLYFITLFETGGRISEVLLLRPDQIYWNEKIIKIENMEVLKQRGKRLTRNVIIKIDGNPLAHTFIDHVEECDTRYLLPGYGTPGNTSIDPNEHISRTYIYKKICEIDPDIWPHWIRDQRSWHLSEDIELDGRGFDSYLLKEWYAWESIEMPAHYAGRRGEADILEHFGVEDIRTREALANEISPELIRRTR